MYPITLSPKFSSKETKRDRIHSRSDTNWMLKAMCPLISVRSLDTTSLSVTLSLRKPSSKPTFCFFERYLEWIVNTMHSMQNQDMEIQKVTNLRNINPPHRAGWFWSPVPNSRNRWPSVIAFALPNANQDGLRKAWNESKRNSQLTVSAPPCLNVYCEIYDYKKLIKKMRPGS